MAGLPFEELPAVQADQIKTQLQSQWQIEARALSVRPFRSQQLANAEEKFWFLPAPSMMQVLVWMLKLQRQEKQCRF